MLLATLVTISNKRYQDIHVLVLKQLHQHIVLANKLR